MKLILVSLATATFTLSAHLVRLASQQTLQVVEAEVRLEQTVSELQTFLDRRCRDDHQRLNAHIRWYIMRRSGQDELDRFDQREATWVLSDSQP